MGMEGFEPTHPKELIYSQPPLSNLAASPMFFKLALKGSVSPNLAETVRFELTDRFDPVSAFPRQRDRPLCHVSISKLSKPNSLRTEWAVHVASQSSIH